MDFCDNCDSILEPKNINGKIVAYCGDCDEVKGEEISSLKFENKSDDPEGGKILILEDTEDSIAGRAKKEMYCEQCKSSQLVEYWELQTRSADESATRFFRCTNCGKNWREYD